MEFKLIDFAIVVLRIFMFNVFGIEDFSKIQFFKFSSNERVKENKLKKTKTRIK